MSTFYNDRTGELAYTDQAGNIKVYPVKFLDYPAPPDHTPKLADLEYQKAYLDAAEDALKLANRNAKHGFILDNARNDGFKGSGFMDGRIRVFFVREDKKGQVGLDGRRITPSDADYRFEMDSYDDIKTWVFRGRSKVIEEAVARLKEIDEKP
jgi:hypothetical protein